MSKQVPAGYYRDNEGSLKRDRRANDRRGSMARGSETERRNLHRRAVDREFIEREHHSMIEEALSEFAAEHEMH